MVGNTPGKIKYESSQIVSAALFSPLHMLLPSLNTGPSNAVLSATILARGYVYVIVASSRGYTNATTSPIHGLRG